VGSAESFNVPFSREGMLKLHKSHHLGPDNQRSVPYSRQRTLQSYREKPNAPEKQPWWCQGVKRFASIMPPIGTVTEIADDWQSLKIHADPGIMVFTTSIESCLIFNILYSLIWMDLAWTAEVRHLVVRLSVGPEVDFGPQARQSKPRKIR
jgi:hypothetical protein